eukprot:1284632-Alexandrium_andersonii.AAC.1
MCERVRARKRTLAPSRTHALARTRPRHHALVRRCAHASVHVCMLARSLDRSRAHAHTCKCALPHPGLEA